MSYVNGTHKAGMAEALRHAQGVIHRDVQTGMVIAAGERQDRARATQVHAPPEAEEWNPEHDDQEAGGGHRRRRDGEAEDGAPGTLVDLAA